MILVLDTEALWHAPLLAALGEAKERLTPASLQVVLPVVAYAERRQQYLTARRPVAELRRTLELLDIFVEPLGQVEADRVREGLPAEVWRAHGRDFLIAAHIHGERIGVSSDRGPAWQGIAVRSPAEAAVAVRSLFASGAA